MEELTVNHWRRYGKDRLYVNLQDGTRVGWLDLQTGQATLEREDLGAAFELALRRHRAAGEAPHQVRTTEARPTRQAAALDDNESPADDPDAYAVQVDWRDLAGHRPGQSARGQADARRRAAPIRTLAARALGLHTDERAWRIGAVGEEKVAARLDRLSDEWKVLHALPVGTQGSDIDHLVVGPGGVFTVNAKHHPDARIWVGGDAFLVNGSRQPYVRNS
ncbi:MAG TPA: nuclease-related domain-containing protein, partial [Nitriliruptorales bacterium]|nr:nuclease-related domain-containing protein [Nitriliruptorales bacterium]